MELSQSQKNVIQKQFDSFCKVVLRNKSRDIERQRKRRGDREICFSALSVKDMQKLFVTDKFSFDYNQFNVMGYPITVRNEQLAEAISSLSCEKRDVLLLSYFLGLNDREIAEMLNMIQRTVQRKRSSSIEKIKEKRKNEGDEFL